MEAVKTLFIVGPTASGKSALALHLARHLNAEIICADSQTIRRGMDIGTAKPTFQDQKLVRHHLLDIIEPYKDYSAGQFKAAAESAIENINNRGKVAIIVGGTGLYVDALFYDYSFDGQVADPELRAQLAAKTVTELQTEITAKNLKMPTNSQNPRHLIRTIESGGMKAQDKSPRPSSLIIGLNPGREIVKKRIAERAAYIFDHGFMDEVHGLIKKYGVPSREFDAIAYKVTMQQLGIPLKDHNDAAKAAISTAESQFAKRQVAWFKRNPHINWFQNAEQASAFVFALVQ